MRRLIPVLLTLSTIACNRSDSDLARFFEDGRAKPVVAVASVIDGTSLDLPWSLSEELTSLVVGAIAKGGSIFVNVKDGLASTDTPFTSDLSWVKREFPEDQFVVFLELVEHEVVAASPNKKSPAEPFESAMNLKMAVKMRVIDLRNNSPRIVLQEMVRDSYYIPKNAVPTDYRISGWGTNDFLKSPMGLAHQQLVHEISLRIRDYIQLAKSR